jgi:hypothetical protein
MTAGTLKIDKRLSYFSVGGRGMLNQIGCGHKNSISTDPQPFRFF